jgi:signal transduction histidine kinase/CheY-like chemotaxis protein
MTNSIQFQNIILKIATELININLNQFDEVIQDTLALVGEFLDVDRVYVFEYNHNKTIATNTYEWCNKGVEPQIDKLKETYTEDLMDILVAPHLAGENVIVENVPALSKTNPLYLQLMPQGIKSLTTTPLIDDQNCLGFVGYDDVRTERKWNEKETGLLKVLAGMITNAMLTYKNQKILVDLKEKANQASKEKTHFLSKISHEFRTPLNGAKNALYLLNSTRITSEQKEYVDIATYSVESLISMIGDILDISKIESGQIEIYKDIFDLENELVNMLLTEQNIAEEKGLDIIFDFDYTINHLFTSDLQKIRQIILNLVNNAIKYTNQGSITLGVKKIKETDNFQTIEFVVKDTGIGIDKVYFEKIFEKFFQIESGNSRSYEGTGLGLAIVKELVDQLEGNIHLDSHMNQGSTFTCRLKLDKNEKYDFTKAKKIKVLIIDNDIKSQKMFKILESMQMKVEMLKNISNSYDIIIFSEEKSYDLIKYYKNNFGKKEAIIIGLYNENANIDETDIIFNNITSRNQIYQKISTKMNGDKQDIKDLYMSELSGYALVVDDNRLNRIVLENILRKEGIKSKLVNSGLEAIEAVQKERFDIVLMDIQMPKMDGMETSNRIRDLGPQYKYLPIIAVTANAFLNDYDLMKKAQMNDVLFKPINIEQLERLLRNYISHQKYIFIPQQYIVFDVKEYEKRFEGSMDIARSVIKAFIETYHEDIKKIESAIEQQHKKEIEQTIHYFKGSCAYLSGKRTTWLLTLMMDMNTKDDMDHLKKAYEVLVFEVQKLIQELKIYIENHKLYA